MTLPASGNPIKLSQVDTELGLSASAQLNLGASSVRTLFGVNSGPINMGSGFSQKRNWIATTGISTTGMRSPTFWISPESVTVDTFGNMYLVGYEALYNGANIDGGIIQKFNQSGVLQWSYSIVMPSGYFYTVKCDNSGNVYVAGTGYIFTNPTPTVGYFAKFDSSGSLLWQKTLSSTSTISLRPLSMVLDGSNNVYIVGNYYDTNGGFHGLWLVKYNSSGTLQWQRKLVNADNGSNYYGAISLDSTGYLNIVSYNFLIRYDTSGNLQYWKNFSGTFVGYGCATDSSGNIYVVGENSPRYTMIKLNSSGVIQWQKRITHTLGSNDYGFLSVVDSSGNPYLIGTYDTSGSGTGYVISIIKFDSVGNITFQTQLSGITNYAISRVATIDSLNNICFGGPVYVGGSEFYRGMIIKLPTDGSKTGTYTVGANTFVYSTSSLTSIIDPGYSIATYAGTESALGYTDGTPTYTTSSFSPSATVVGI